MKAILLAFVLSLGASGAYAEFACTPPSPLNTFISYTGLPSHCDSVFAPTCLTTDTLLFSEITNGNFGCEGHNYSWNFGDGTFGSGQSATHSFASPGTYLITLTLTSEFSQTTVLTRTLNIQTPATLPAIDPRMLALLLCALAMIALPRLR